jgi:hypothetical protein
VADPMEIAKTFGIPLLGAVTGWISAAWKATSRVTSLEVDYEKYKKNNKEAFDEYKKTVREEFVSLIAAWKLEITHQKQDVNEKITELKTEVKELRDSFDRFTRASHHDFADNEAFTRYVEEMNRQWKAVERTLGHIEGWMKAQSKHPSTFPPSQTSRSTR